MWAAPGASGRAGRERVTPLRRDPHPCPPGAAHSRGLQVPAAPSSTWSGCKLSEELGRGEGRPPALPDSPRLPPPPLTRSLRVCAAAIGAVPALQCPGQGLVGEGESLEGPPRAGMGGKGDGRGGPAGSDPEMCARVGVSGSEGARSCPSGMGSRANEGLQALQAGVCPGCVLCPASPDLPPGRWTTR